LRRLGGAIRHRLATTPRWPDPGARDRAAGARSRMSDLARTRRITHSLGIGPWHRGWWRSLRMRFAIAISSLIALVLLANALVLVLSSRSQLEREIEARALGFAELAVHPVCQAYETYYSSGYSKFRELVLQVAELNPDV